MRICLKIGYDGTNYNGWDSGKTGIDIKTVITKAICELIDDDIKLIGTSRTDAGVHAEGNVAVFDTNRKVNANKIFFAINNLLPSDIVIKDSFAVDDAFEPRKVESKKTYLYRIYNDKIRNPILDRYTHFVYYDVDIEKMIKASRYLIGEHDFKSFVNPESNTVKNGQSTVRNIEKIDIIKNDKIINIYIVGNGFLYNMVRIICGTLLKIGMNMWDIEYIKTILDKKDRRYAGFTLPAKGLTLMNIEFKYN